MYDRAIEHYERIASFKDNEIKFSEDLLDLFKTTKRRDFSLAEALYLIGKSLFNLEEKDEAKKYFSRSLSMARKMELKTLINKILMLSDDLNH